MNAFAAELEAAGVHQDSSSLALRCEDGKDSLETRDTYRFRCQVEYVGYHGWSGDFAAGAQALIAAIPPECGGASEATLARAPSTDSRSSGPRYVCPSWGGVGLNFGSTSGLSTHLSWLDWFSCDSLERCKRNPSADEVYQALKGYDWYATIYVTKIYYEDPR